MDELQRESEKLYNAAKLYCGGPTTSQEKQLVEMARRLYDEFRGIHNPRALEAQATQIKEFLYHMQPGAMTTTHCMELKSGYEHLRVNLRKFE